MLVKGITEKRLQEILNAQGLTSDIKRQGRYLHIRPKRNTPACRIVPMGSNWEFKSVNTCSRVAEFYNTAAEGYIERKKSPCTRTLGNVDWYELTCTLLTDNDTERGERIPVIVRLLDQTFESIGQYTDWVYDSGLLDYIGYERAMRRTAAHWAGR